MNSTELPYLGTQSWIESFYELNSFVMLGFVMMEYILAHYIQNELILTDQLFIHSWSEQLTVERIREILKIQEQWEWIGFFGVLVFVLAKLFLTTVCLNIGTFLVEYKVGFRTLWKMVVNAMAIFAIGKLIYVGYLATIDIQSVEDVMEADIYSLLSVTGYDQVPQWALFALGSINLLELFYWFVLSLGIMLVLKVKWKKAIGFVMMTYGVGWWIWLLAGTFMLINLYGV